MANNDECNDEYLCRDFFAGSFFGRVYHSRYRNFEFTGLTRGVFQNGDYFSASLKSLVKMHEIDNYTIKIFINSDAILNFTLIALKR